MGKRGSRVAGAVVLLTAGLFVVGAVNAGNALADCGGSSGDSCGASSVIFGVEQQAGHFGETLHIHGFVNDDSDGCFLSRFACHLPAGKVVVTDQTGRVLGTSYLAYWDSETAQWGFHWNGLGSLQGAPPSSEITIHTLPAGNYTATATYVPESINGDGYFDASSATFDFSVAKADTDVSLTQSNASSVTGQSTSLTATVTGVFNGLYADEFGGFSHKPNGAVIFYEDGEVVDAALLNNGVASIDAVLSNYGHGFGQLYAEYVGLDDYNGDSSAVVAHSFTKGNSSVTLTQPSDTSAVGPNFPITATVSAVSPASGTPSGNVTFVDTGSNTTLGTVTLSSGAATIQIGGSVGTHSIKATYNGDTGYNTSNNSITHVVTKGDVSNVLTQPKTTSVYGEAITFTDALGVVAPALGTPTGDVTFSDGQTVLGSLPYASTALLLASFEVGSHSISTSYAGDGNFNAKTSNTLTHVVTKADTATGLVASVADPVPLGTPVTFTASVAVVAPGAATPSGFVQFYDGTSTSGAPVSVTGGSAVTTMTFGGGSHSITAKYLGDSHLNSSTSAVVTRSVPCDRTVTGTLGNYTAPNGGLTCISNASIHGSLTVPSGASVYLIGSQVNGSTKITNPGAAMICKSTLFGPLTLKRSVGAVVFGFPKSACRPNTVNGAAQFSGNQGGTTIGGNTFKLQLTCTGNTPAPVNGGSANDAQVREGQCAAPNF